LPAGGRYSADAWTLWLSMSAITYPDEVLATAVALGRALETAGVRVVCAESCTGGLIATALTEIGGSSAWFDRGFVTYTNASKHEILGVPDALLAAHGAVSEPVARAMASGALAASGAAVALSVTGIAGPGGGSADKPVGTVCFGWALAWPGQPVRLDSQTRLFEGERARVRGGAALFALEGALARLTAIGAAGMQHCDPADALAKKG
jgi:nicotinamide-nucleotide amidase